MYTHISSLYVCVYIYLGLQLSYTSITSKFRASKHVSTASSQHRQKPKDWARPSQAVNPSQCLAQQWLVQTLLGKQQTGRRPSLPRSALHPGLSELGVYLPVSSKQTSVWPSVWPYRIGFWADGISALTCSFTGEK